MPKDQRAGRRRRESNHRSGTSVERRHNSLRCGSNRKVPEERNRGRGAKRRRDTRREKYRRKLRGNYTSNIWCIDKEEGKKKE